MLERCDGPQTPFCFIRRDSHVRVSEESYRTSDVGVSTTVASISIHCVVWAFLATAFSDQYGILCLEVGFTGKNMSGRDTAR